MLLSRFTCCNITIDNTRYTTPRHQGATVMCFTGAPHLASALVRLCRKYREKVYLVTHCVNLSEPIHPIHRDESKSCFLSHQQPNNSTNLKSSQSPNIAIHLSVCASSRTSIQEVFCCTRVTRLPALLCYESWCRLYYSCRSVTSYQVSYHQYY